MSDHRDITHEVVGCAMKAHSTLRNGFQEVIYQRALAIEMNKRNIRFEREKEMTIYYDGSKIGRRRADFFVEDCIMIEIKALNQLEHVHFAQIMNYLEAYNIKIGLLLNFGAKSLEFKRIHNNKISSYSNHA